MGDAADDVYDAAERLETYREFFMHKIREGCIYLVLGRKPCNMITNEPVDDEEDCLPVRCRHCGRTFDYP